MGYNLKNENFYIQWHITDACNLRCTHCYQENYSSKNDLPLVELKMIADQILTTFSKWGKRGDISITGGEPLLRKDLFEILHYLNESSDVNHLDILTNGTLINDSIIDNFKSLSKFKYVQISLDGASSIVHDSIRGIGSYNKAISAIRKLVKRDIEVRIMYTLQKSNLSEVPEMIDLAIREKISGLTFERIVPTGNSKGHLLLALSTKEVKEAYEYIGKRSDIEFKNGNNIKILKFRPLWILIDPCRKNDGTNPCIELGATCSIGLDGICILPNADVLACRRLPIPIGNLKIDTFQDIWTTSKLLLQISNKKNLNGKCNSCSYIPICSGCRAMAYAFTGNYLDEDPNCWK